MTSETQHLHTFVSLRIGAIRLGVPSAWLKAEAVAGRVPFLRVGRRLLVNPEAVKAALLARAQTKSGEVSRVE